MFRLLQLLPLLLLLSICPAEDCFNGGDDDGDGLIDLNDPDCRCVSRAETTGQELIFNGGFELLADTPECQGCISLFDSDNCPLGWLQASINLHAPCFLGSNPSQNIGYIVADDNYQGMGGYGIDVNNNRVQQEFLQTTLQNPLETGQTYFFSGDFDLPAATIPGINLAETHRIVLLGHSGTDQPINSNGSGCYEDRPGWITLAYLDFANNAQDVFNTNGIAFVAPAPITTFVLASACCQPDTPEAERLSYFGIDNLSLARAQPMPLEASIGITDNSCSEPFLLCTPPMSNADFQWYLEGVAIPGATTNCQVFPASTANDATIQVWITTDDNCVIIDTTLNRPCPQSPEICDNGVDDDGDGFIDFNDPDCSCDGPVVPLAVAEFYCPTRIRLNAGAGNNADVQWYVSGIALEGNTGSIIQLDSTANLLATYFAVITNQDGSCQLTESFSPSLPSDFQFSWTSEVASCPQGDDARILTQLNNIDTSGYQFIWRDAAGTIVSNTASLIEVAAGVYRLKVINAEGCSNYFEFIIQDRPEPFTQVIVNYDDCNNAIAGGNLNIQLFGSPSISELCYFVSPNDSTPICTNESELFLPNGNYSGFVIDASGCRSEWGPVNIMASSPATINISADAEKINLGQEINVSINAPPGQINWQPQALFDCSINCRFTQIQPFENTLILATHTDPVTGCTVSDSLFIEVEATANLYAPTAFSPNFDGINDKWELFFGTSISELGPLTIFDRWGGIIFEGPAINGWNGMTYSNTPAPTGLYLFITEVGLLNGKKERVSGEILLIK